MMDTREVAAYLRLKERRIYDLVRANALPHVRATGKLLFPRDEVDAWLASKSASPQKARAAAPAIVAGSHDPLLEWAARESGSGLAVLACGSRAGLDSLADGAAIDRGDALARRWRRVQHSARARAHAGRRRRRRSNGRSARRAWSSRRAIR